jgi:hypothetical protein
MDSTAHFIRSPFVRKISSRMMMIEKFAVCSPRAWTFWRAVAIIPNNVTVSTKHAASQDLLV